MPKSASRNRPAIIAAIIVAALVLGGAVWGIAANTTGKAEQQQIPQGALHADTTLGAIELRVGNLEAMQAFYEVGVGLRVLDESAESVSLGSDGVEIIRLTAADGGYTNPKEAGLYHAAILYPDAPGLAAAIARIVQADQRFFQGASDHAVSKAFYFGDPEGNGVELYIDTPRDSWVWQDGQVQMGSAALDPNAFLAEHLGSDADGTIVPGHAHLKVGDLDAAREFYGDTLGFAVTAETNGAIFLAVGGYHHHLAANTWGSSGAGIRPASLGLGSLEITLPNAAELAAVADRLDTAGLAHERTDAAITVLDPWGTPVHLTIAG
jgi:catechol 2,3-dioxygenase